MCYFFEFSRQDNLQEIYFMFRNFNRKILKIESCFWRKLENFADTSTKWK